MGCRHVLFFWASPAFSLRSFRICLSNVLLIPHPNFILAFPKAPLSYLSDPHRHHIIWKFFYYLRTVESQIYPFIPDLTLFQTKPSMFLWPPVDNCQIKLKMVTSSSWGISVTFLLNYCGQWYHMYSYHKDVIFNLDCSLFSNVKNMPKAFQSPAAQHLQMCPSTPSRN